MLPKNKTALIGILILLAVFPSACTTKEEAAKRFLQEGKELLEQGKADQARVQFKNAIQKDPKLAEAYYNVALLDEKKQDWKGMFGNLLEASRLDPNLAEAHFKLGLAFLSARQLDKASEEADTLEKLRPGQTVTLTLRGNILFHQGKKAEGIELVRQALEKEPTNYDSAVILSSLYLGDGSLAEALATLKRGIDAHPKDIGLQLMKIQAEVENKDYETAITDYNALIEQNPDKRELNYGLVQLLIKIGRKEEAEATLRGIIVKSPKDTDAKLALVGYIGHTNESDAEKTLAEFAAKDPDDIRILSNLAGLYASKKRYDEAQAVLKRIIDIDKNGRGGLAAKVELAKIALLQKDDKAANTLIEEVITADSANPEAHLLRAAMRLDKNNMDGAIADLRIVLTANPKQDQALVMLAKAYQRNGNAEIAESNLRQALEINPGNLEAALPIAAKMIMGKELDRAEEVLNAALKPNPGDPTALQLLAQVRTLKKDFSGAQALASKLGQQSKGSAAGHFLSGEIFANQGKYDDAIKQYQAALQEKPDSPEVIRALAQVYNAKGERVQFKSYLKAFIEKNPKVSSAHIALGFSHAADKEWNDAVKVLQNALQTDPKSQSAYQALAGVYQAQDKPDQEIEVLRKGLAELPDNLPLMVGLGQVYERVKNSEAAITLYQQILQQQPKLELALNNLASVLADYRTDKQSLQQAAKLVETFSSASNPNLMDTYAWVTLRNGDKDKAIPVFKRAIAAAPDEAIFHYHLGTAYFQSFDNASAKTELERSLELAKTKGDFVGIEQARNLLKDIAQTPDKTK